MLSLYLLILCFCKSKSGSIPPPTSTDNTTTPQEEEIIGETRRILQGREIYDTRPYMVYLRPTKDKNVIVDQNWLCGGVIIDERYILTSAACIEDIKYFYVVSGTHRWLPMTQTSKCIENGALRAVWKCFHRTYRFDGTVFNNIRWMVNDIAVVMTESSISFTRRVKGCDFIPQKIGYNNSSKNLENPGKKGFIAGWGSTDKYTDVSFIEEYVKSGIDASVYIWRPVREAADIMTRTVVNSPLLLEAETIIITKESCSNRWLPRYHSIIKNYMICGKLVGDDHMSEACDGTYVECRHMVVSEEDGPRIRRFERDPDKLLLHSAAHARKSEKTRRNTRRALRKPYGGFCENDHGGPLVLGRGKSSIVVGIMSAYRVENNSKSCHGPFLYTSVYDNRHLIHCALYKKEGNDCDSVLRGASSVLEEEIFDWGNVTIRQRTIYDDDEDNTPVLRSSDVLTPTSDDQTHAEQTDHSSKDANASG